MRTFLTTWPVQEYSHAYSMHEPFTLQWRQACAKCSMDDGPVLWPCKYVPGSIAPSLTE